MIIPLFLAIPKFSDRNSRAAPFYLPWPPLHSLSLSFLRTGFCRRNQSSARYLFGLLIFFFSSLYILWLCFFGACERSSYCCLLRNRELAAVGRQGKLHREGFSLSLSNFYLWGFPFNSLETRGNYRRRREIVVSFEVFTRIKKEKDVLVCLLFIWGDSWLFNTWKLYDEIVFFGW